MSLKRKRSGIYSNSTGSLVYDPIKGEARSYGWYVLAKRIGGVMYLNTYGYSNTTSKHVSIMHKQFEYRDYQCIEAPQGLQDLECAHRHNIERAKYFEEKATKARTLETRSRYLQESAGYYDKAAVIGLLNQAERVA
jgi:hypothetical protein